MKSTKIVALLIAATMAIAPALSFARAGGSFSGGGGRSSSSFPSGSRSISSAPPSPASSTATQRSSGAMQYESSGSRGARTYDSVPSAKPIDRTVTQKPAPTLQPTAPAAPVAPAASYQPVPSYQPAPAPVAQSSGFWGPFAGAMAGTWIGSMLFNHNSNGAVINNNGGGGQSQGSWGGADNHAADTMLSFFPWLLFGAILLMLAVWQFRRKNDDYAHAIVSTPRREVIDCHPAAAFSISAASPCRSEDRSVSQADIDPFGATFKGVQEAWGKQDINKLHRYLTPEMLSYFSLKLTEMSSQGVSNLVEDVSIAKITMVEAWTEDTMEYATARIAWTARDYVVRPELLHADPGYIVDGDPTALTEAEEVWTFARSVNGGHWVLSAIQQVAN